LQNKRRTNPNPVRLFVFFYDSSARAGKGKMFFDAVVFWGFFLRPLFFSAEKYRNAFFHDFSRRRNNILRTRAFSHFAMFIYMNAEVNAAIMMCGPVHLG